MEFSMFPTDQGESLSAHVARLVRIVRDSQLPHRLGPMGTTVEGEPGEVLDLLKRCLEDLQRDCRRVAGFVKLDWRAGRTDGLHAKVESVERRLGEARRL